MFGVFTAARHYRGNGLVRFREQWLGFAVTFVAAGIGAWTVQRIDPHLLSNIIPFFLLVIALYTVFTPSLGAVATRARMNGRWFSVVFGILLGFYDGFFGPGVGTFWAISFMTLLGCEIRTATARTKVMNLASNIMSVIMFGLGGSILWSYGAVMAAGQIIGARIGAGLAVKKGIRVIRPLYIIVVFATIAKLLLSRFL